MEMSLREQLHRWRNHFRQQGSEPTFVPLTAEELTVLVSDCRLGGNSAAFYRTYFPCADAVTANKLYGCDIFESPFSLTMRQRQIDMAVTQLEESAEVPMYREACSEDRVRDLLRRRLVARICSDTTRLDLTFEWDVFAAFKRKFKLTRWFPVKTRTVAIDGRVLYPYLKIALPHNRHHATFRHVQ